jgi:tryptophan 2,3-dioxygenase
MAASAAAKTVPAAAASSSSSSEAASSTEGCPFTAATQLEASNRAGAHDEHLFIVIHQAFELWFKQVLWELGDAQRLMNCQ